MASRHLQLILAEWLIFDLRYRKVGRKLGQVILFIQKLKYLFIHSLKVTVECPMLPKRMMALCKICWRKTLNLTLFVEEKLLIKSTFGSLYSFFSTFQSLSTPKLFSVWNFWFPKSSFLHSGLRVPEPLPVYSAPKEWPLSATTPDAAGESLRGAGLPLRFGVWAS